MAKKIGNNELNKARKAAARTSSWKELEKVAGISETTLRKHNIFPTITTTSHVTSAASKVDLSQEAQARSIDPLSDLTLYDYAACSHIMSKRGRVALADYVVTRHPEELLTDPFETRRNLIAAFERLQHLDVAVDLNMKAIEKSLHRHATENLEKAIKESSTYGWYEAYQALEDDGVQALEDAVIQVAEDIERTLKPEIGERTVFQQEGGSFSRLEKGDAITTDDINVSSKDGFILGVQASMCGGKPYDSSDSEKSVQWDDPETYQRHKFADGSMLIAFGRDDDGTPAVRVVMHQPRQLSDETAACVEELENGLIAGSRNFGHLLPEGIENVR